MIKIKKTESYIENDVIKQNNLPNWVEGISSFYKKQMDVFLHLPNLVQDSKTNSETKRMLEKMNLIIKNNYKSCNVTCSRLSDVLASHLIKKIDILIIDVEGADYMVFDQFDFSKYSPYIVCVEIKHMNETNIEKLISKLKLEGYNVKRYRNDVLGIKEI